MLWRDTRRYLRTRNRQSSLPGASLFQPEIHPFPLFPFRSSPLRRRTRNYKFSQWTDDSLAPLPLSFLPSLHFVPLRPLQPPFPSFTGPDFLGELSLFLLLFLCLSLSLSLGSSIRTSSTLSLFSLSLSLSLSLFFSLSLYIYIPRFSLAWCIRPFSLYAHGYLIPREWKREREEWEANISGTYVYLTREGSGMKQVRGRGGEGQGKTEDKWTHCEVLVQW